MQRGGAHPHRDADVPVTVTYEVTTSVALGPSMPPRSLTYAFGAFNFFGGDYIALWTDHPIRRHTPHCHLWQI